MITAHCRKVRVKEPIPLDKAHGCHVDLRLHEGFLQGGTK